MLKVYLYSVHLEEVEPDEANYRGQNLLKLLSMSL